MREHLQVRDHLPAHDGLELPRAYLAGRVAQRTVARHVHEVRLGHVDPVILREREGGREERECVCVCERERLGHVDPVFR